MESKITEIRGYFDPKRAGRLAVSEQEYLNLVIPIIGIDLYLVSEINPARFVWLPKEFQEIISKLPTSQTIGVADIIEKSSQIINEGGLRLFNGAWGNYAADHSLIRETGSETFRKGQEVIDLKEARKEEILVWIGHLGKEGVSREVVVDILTGDFRDFDPIFKPSFRDESRYSPIQKVRELCQRLLRFPYAFTLALLPDLTDAEAARLFGQFTTKEQVNELANLRQPIVDF